MSKTSKNDSLLFWTFAFQIIFQYFYYLFINFKDLFYLIFVFPSPSFRFKFLSLCSAPSAYWKDIFMLVCFTLWLTDSWLCIEWDLGTGQSFLPCSGFHGKESMMEVTSLFKEFSLQLRISYFSNMCDQLTNRTSRKQSVHPSQNFFSFWNFLYIHYLQIILRPFRPCSCHTSL